MNAQVKLLHEDYGVIVAADVTTIDKLQSLAEISAHVEEVVGIKVGFSLALRYGLPSLVKAIRDKCSLPVIYDHQKAGTDIPQMGKALADCCVEAGIIGVIIFPQAGPKTLESFVGAIFERDMVPIVGLVMTHPAYLVSEGGFIADDAPKRICEIALENGVRHFVLPGTKTELVSEYVAGPLLKEKPCKILMPGIGSQGGEIARAFSAAKGHHCFAIIGSAIYGASDPLKAAENFASEIREAAL